MNRILVVDDDVAYIKSIVYILVKNLDCDVLSATTGVNAINIVKRTALDLILIDWDMPEKSGIETIIELKNDDILCDIPVIMMSGVMMTSTNLKTAMQIGAVDFLRKPIDEIELVSRVRNMLQISEMQKQIKQQNIVLQNQLASKIVSIQHFSERKKLVYNKLQELKKHMSGSEKTIIDFINSLEELINSNSLEWNEFQTNFEFIYQGFFRKIKQLYPNLTTSELRLCAFIRLNMSNKEIAKVICISPNSVNTARKRFKRKIGLDMNSDLTDFLINL
ncbi:MAG: response regulator [Paludibacteraceae bacterium]|nr:response regulator [Paludibacteraceae bacterium]